jgi:hypothetical protein
MSLSLHDQLRSTLDELAASDLPLSTPGASLVVQHYGDALRAGITVPMALRKQLHSASLSMLRAIADEARGDIEDLPASFDAFEDPSVELALRARDQLESVLVGLRRIALAHGLMPDEFDPIHELAVALEQFDRRAAQSQPRNRVEQLLAERMSLHASAGWLDRYEHRDADELRVEVSFDASNFRPTPEQLTNWATRGLGTKHIEAWAARSDENTEDLLALLDVLRAEGLALSLNALRWSRARAGASTIEWNVRPQTRLAAGSSQPTEDMHTIDLGQLGSLRAFARLLITSASTLLRVRAEKDAIQSLQFGDQTLDAPDERDTWTIEVRAPHGPLALVVTNADGESFRCTLVIGPAHEG